MQAEAEAARPCSIQSGPIPISPPSLARSTPKLVVTGRKNKNEKHLRLPHQNNPAPLHDGDSQHVRRLARLFRRLARRCSRVQVLFSKKSRPCTERVGPKNRRCSEGDASKQATGRASAACGGVGTNHQGKALNVRKPAAFLWNIQCQPRAVSPETVR